MILLNGWVWPKYGISLGRVFVCKQMYFLYYPEYLLFSICQYLPSPLPLFVPDIICSWSLGYLVFQICCVNLKKGFGLFLNIQECHSILFSSLLCMYNRSVLSRIHTMFDSTLLDLLFLISMSINLILLVGLLIRPSLRTHLNLFLSCLIILNLLKIFLDFASR